MSMHLCGPGLSTTSTKRKKSKPVTVTAKLAEEFRIYNKQMRRLGLKEKTVDEYIAYKQGKSKYTPKIVKDPFTPETYRRTSPEIPSGNGVGNGFVKPAMVYSGARKLIGVAVLHKSCLQPVFSQQDAEDIARMRR